MIEMHGRQAADDGDTCTMRGDGSIAASSSTPPAPASAVSNQTDDTSGIDFLNESRSSP